MNPKRSADEAQCRKDLYNMSDNKFIILSSVFFLMFIFGMGTLFVEKPLSNFLNAATATVSVDKSLITAIPQVCSLSNTSPNFCPDKKIRVDVYIRNEKGSLLAKKTVKLSTNLPNVSIHPTDTQNTNEGGKAEFFLTSTIPGIADLTVVETTSGKTINQHLSVVFAP